MSQTTCNMPCFKCGKHLVIYGFFIAMAFVSPYFLIFFIDLDLTDFGL